jgi:hypothetical protein
MVGRSDRAALAQAMAQFFAIFTKLLRLCAKCYGKSQKIIF